ERPVPCRLRVAVHERLEAVRERARLRGRLLLQELRHHRDRGLGDRAAVAGEPGTGDAAVLQPELEADLVAAARVQLVGLGVRALELAAVARPLVMLENQ